MNPRIGYLLWASGATSVRRWWLYRRANAAPRAADLRVVCFGLAAFLVGSATAALAQATGAAAHVDEQ